MKRILYLLTMTVGLWSCQNQTMEKTADKNAADTSQQQVDTSGKQQPDIGIKDKSLYDQAFIEGLAAYPEPVKLIDNYLITGADTAYFPDDLPVNKPVTFKGNKDNKNFVLEVTRTNLTSLTYNFMLTGKDNKAIEKKSGKAILSSLFFLASEVDEDSETGIAYGSSEYHDKSNNCWFTIRIGIGKDDNGKQRATPGYYCNDKSKQTLNLDECPTLRTE